MKWIKCEDEMPGDPQEVITWGGHEIPMQLGYSGGKFWEDDWNDEIVGITHWMPIPEPPEGE